MKYNYVFYNLNDDYFKPMAIPLGQEDGVLFWSLGIGNNKLCNLIFFLHWSKKINRIVTLPFKCIWFRRIYSNPFKNKKPICFVFAGGKYITESKGLRKYIFMKSPSNKCIVYCADLIAKKSWDVEKVKQSCDAIVTYDPGEAEKYGIYCFDKPIYGRIKPLTQPEQFEYDAFFLGFAKDRLDTIRYTYKKLTDAGLKCLFIVCGVDKEKQLDDGIRYQKPISYDENIQLVQKSRCLVEIIQGSSNSATLRTEEAIVYHRKLLTNHVRIAETDYYNPEYMSTFLDPDEIDIEFIKKPINYESFKEDKELDPVQLLDFFEKILEEKDNESTDQRNNSCI